MKRIIFCCIILSFLLLFTACSHPLTWSRTELMEILQPAEEKGYNEVMTAFWDAVHRNDEDAIYELFSSRAHEIDPSLKDDIHTLVEMYPDGTDQVFPQAITASHHWYSGEEESIARSTTTLLADGTYFVCNSEVLYEYTEDPSQRGIICMDFFTEDEYCIFRKNDENYAKSGLMVYNTRTLECDFRLIENYLYDYVPIDRQLDVAEVKAFLETSNSYQKFLEEFGEPNAGCNFYFYELPPEEDEPRYLKVYNIRNTDEIHSVDLVNDLKYIETLWEEDRG